MGLIYFCSYLFFNQCPLNLAFLPRRMRHQYQAIVMTDASTNAQAERKIHKKKSMHFLLGHSWHLVSIWLRHFYCLHSHQNACYQLACWRGVWEYFCRRLESSLALCATICQWLTCDCRGRSHMVMESLKSSQSDMWVNFMPNSLFTKKHVCLWN